MLSLPHFQMAFCSMDWGRLCLWLTLAQGQTIGPWFPLLWCPLRDKTHSHEWVRQVLYLSVTAPAPGPCCLRQASFPGVLSKAVIPAFVCKVQAMLEKEWAFHCVQSEQWGGSQATVGCVLCDLYTKWNLIAPKTLCKLVVDPKCAKWQGGDTGKPEALGHCTGPGCTVWGHRTPGQDILRTNSVFWVWKTTWRHL